MSGPPAASDAAAPQTAAPTTVETAGLRGRWPGPDELSSVAEHRDRVLAEVGVLGPVNATLAEALGASCAEDVVAQVSLPRFDNSAMDGYAVRHADLAGAGPSSPIELPVVGEIGAGRPGPGSVGPGQAAKIMTGAPLPEGADAVVPYEWTDRGAARVVISRAPEPGAHLRAAGEDLSIGDLLVEAGTVLGARHLGLLASVGRARVEVGRRPVVAVLSTGSELRDAGTPIAELDDDSIYDGNSHLLAAALVRAGAIAVRVGIVADDPASFDAALREQLATADAVITSGGVSQGDWDVVKAALAPQGVWFGPVAMQPGKPQGFGVLTGPAGRRVPVFALPGNPVSAYVSFQVFVLPALRRMSGAEPRSRPLRRARLTRAVTSPVGREQYLRGLLGTDGQGVHVEPVGGSGSHLVGDLAGANCLVVVPAEAAEVAAGAMVDVLALDEDF